MPNAGLVLLRMRFCESSFFTMETFLKSLGFIKITGGKPFWRLRIDDLTYIELYIENFEPEIEKIVQCDIVLCNEDGDTAYRTTKVDSLPKLSRLIKMI